MVAEPLHVDDVLVGAGDARQQAFGVSQSLRLNLQPLGPQTSAQLGRSPGPGNSSQVVTVTLRASTGPAPARAGSGPH